MRTSANLDARLYDSAPALPDKGAGLSLAARSEEMPQHLFVITQWGTVQRGQWGRRRGSGASESVLPLEVLPREKQGVEMRRRRARGGWRGKGAREETGVGMGVGGSTEVEIRVSAR